MFLNFYNLLSYVTAGAFKGAEGTITRSTEGFVKAARKLASTEMSLIVWFVSTQKQLILINNKYSVEN